MSRRIILAEDVLALGRGERLVAGADVTVTAGARDLAQRRGVEIVDDDAGGSGPATAAQAAARAADVVLAGQIAAAPFAGGGAPGTLIVTAVGVNRPGVLAELSAAVGELSGDILDVSQRITGGYFNAILIVDIRRSGTSFAAFREALRGLSEPADYVVTIIDERVFTAMHRLG